MTATNKRYSYPRVVAIRIDIHPAGETPINTTRTFFTPVHVCSTYASRERSPYVVTFHESSIELDIVIALQKRAPDIIHSTPADQSMSPYPISLLSQPMKQWRKSNIYRRHATRLTGHISLVCDMYVQYLLVGANPSVLNWHRQRLQPWRHRLSTYHSPTFPTNGLSFPSKGPVQSPV
jgi:hypothetical protein